jgi:hypothetical protein
MVSNRSCALVATDGRKDVTFTGTAGWRMDWSRSAERAGQDTPPGIQSPAENVSEDTSDMRTAFGQYVVSNRSCAVGAKSGKIRVISIGPTG